MENSTYGKFPLWKIPPVRVPITETTHKGFTKYVVGANLVRLGFSILKHAGSRGAARVGCMGGEAHHQNKKINQLDKILGKHRWNIP